MLVPVEMLAGVSAPDLPWNRPARTVSRDARAAKFAASLAADVDADDDDSRDDSRDGASSSSSLLHHRLADGLAELLKLRAFDTAADAFARLLTRTLGAGGNGTPSRE